MINENTSIDRLNDRGRDTMVEHLGIEITEVGPDFLKGRMPVDHRTKQPLGLLHGGANLVLAESLGSIASNEYVDEDHFCVGLEINANHLKSARSGYVFGVARPIHVGRTTQVWEIKITNEADELTCISRFTLAVMERRKK